MQPQTWSFSCGSGTLTETEGRLAVQQTCFQLIKTKKHQEAHRKAFVNKITINNASGKFSTYSHSLIALNSCKAEALTFQMQTDCLEGRTQENLVCAASQANAVLLCSSSVSVRTRTFKESVHDQLVTGQTFFFLIAVIMAQMADGPLAY